MTSHLDAYRRLKRNASPNFESTIDCECVKACLSTHIRSLVCFQSNVDACARDGNLLYLALYERFITKVNVKGTFLQHNIIMTVIDH